MPTDSKPRTAPVQPWDRKPGEAPPAYEYFLTYMRMGPADRSLEKAARHHNRKDTYLRALSARYGWVARVRAWDLQSEAVTRDSLQSELVKAANKKAKQLVKMDGVLVDTCWKGFAQVRRRLKRTITAERAALAAIAAGKKAELPREETWKSIESSLQTAIGFADLAMARIKSTLQDDQGDTGTGVDPEIAAAALRAAAAVKGLTGPGGHGPPAGTGGGPC